MFDGNDDSTTVVYNILNPPFTARYVRIVPLEFHHVVSMRLEIYGCPGIIGYKMSVAEVSVHVAGPIFKGSSKIAKNSSKSWRSTVLSLEHFCIKGGYTRR